MLMTLAFCPEYDIITVPDISNLPPRNKEIEKILISFQGSFAIISRKSHPKSVLRLFKSIRNAVKELVVESPEGERFLTPRHTEEPVIRDKGIITELADISSNLTDIKKTSTEPQTIDLETVWGADSGRVDTKDAQQFFSSFFNNIRSSRSVTVIGDVPLAIILITAFLLYGKVGEMQYKQNPEDKTLQIF